MSARHWVYWGAAMAAALLIADADAAVGRTPTAYGVSDSGEAQYSIPIFAPKGTRGMAPQLALSYGHRSGGLLFGEGWNLSGLSAITVCPKTWAQDGQARAIWLDGNDRFCLDGNQLKLEGSGPYGASGANYRTEIETYARITSHGVTGNTPNSFTVEQKDGLILEYGARADSRIESVASTTAHTWALTTIRDRSGNRVEFYYDEDSASSDPAVQYNGGYRPATITWTTNTSASLSPSYQIAFVYETQPVNEIESGYLAGGTVRDVTRATQINVTHSGTLVRRYTLQYESTLSSTSRSRLASVTECAGSAGTDCLPATTFAYQNGTPGLGTAVATGFSNPTSYSFMVLDVNGDGLSDLLYTSSATCTSGKWMLALSTEAGYATPINTGIADTNCGQAVPIDYNGDGLEDFLVPYSGGTWWVVLGTATGLATPVDTGIPVWSTAGNAKAIDINGDGLEDLVEGDAQAVWYRARELSGTFGAQQYLVNPITSPTTMIVTPIFFDHGMKRRTRAPDFNGDGHGDFAVTFMHFANIYAITFHTELMLANTGFSWGTGTAILGVPIYGDFNGDGYTDVAFDDSGNWVYALSLGTALGALQLGPSAAGQASYGAVALDWDSDGYEDLVVPGTDGYWKLIRSTGEGLPAVTGTPHYFGTLGIALVGDYNGDNLDDILYTDGSGNFGIFPHAGVAPDLLASATDGYGNTISFQYTTLAQGNYTKGSSATFPHQDYQGPLYVVSQYTAPDGNLGTYTMTYWYGEAWLNRQGRGFQSFFFIRPFDSRSGIRDYRYFLRFFPYAGISYWHDLYQPSSSQLFARDAKSYTHHELGSAPEKRYAPYIFSEYQHAWEVGGAFDGALLRTTDHSRLTDSSTGTETSVTTTITEPSSANGVNAGRTWTRQTLVPTLYNDWTNWCIGRAQTTQQIQSHTGYGGTSITRTASATWDGAKCRPTETQVEPTSSTMKVTTELEYDGFGNLWRETVTGIGMPARQTTTTWGSTGQFPHSVTNAEGEQATHAWDLALGVPTSQTDPNGLVVSYLHDNFGRQTRETRPDGTYTESTWIKCPTGVCDPRVHLYRQDEVQGSPGALAQNQTFFDHEDRAIYEYRWVTLPNAYTVIVRGFDSRGRMYTESMPYFHTGSPTYTTITHDLLNRPTQVSRPISASNATAQVTTTHYEGLRTRTVDAEGKESAVYAYVTGQTARSVDHNGYYQAFDFDAFDNPVRVTDSASNVLQSAIYNVRGFRTNSTDIDMGAWSYVPNALGEIVEQTDAKGQTLVFDFDNVGRKIGQIEPVSGGSLVRSWVYGASAANKNVGKVIRAEISGTGVAAYWEQQTFDSLGRPDVTYYNVPGTTWQIDRTYNANGQLDTVTYPTSTSGYRFKLQYDYQGIDLWRVREFSSGSLLWQANALDARLNVTQETLGNGLQTTRQFDAVHGLPDWIRTGPSGSSTGVQNLAYTWDKVGNLSSRQDLNQSLTETFFYDNLHRLDYSQLNGSTNLDLSYDATGNITYKSDVGNYLYSSSRLHAVTAAGGNSYSYDANGNLQAKNGAAVTWTASNKPRTISNGTYTSTFDYTADDQYWRQIATHSNGTETSYYIGGLLEIVSNSASGITAWRHQIKANGRTVAVYTRGSNSVNNVIYPHTDHLGSTEAITDDSGAVVVRESFTAFGKRRGSAWTGVPTSGPGSDEEHIANSTRRGFTGHTMLDNLGLVHMNGRVYDPDIGRFLSADPNIDGPLDTQGWNRYSYVKNNPLSFTDPSGYFLKKLWKKIKKYVKPIVAIAAAYFTYGAVSGLIATQAGAAGAAAASAAGYSTSVGAAIGSAGAAASWTTGAIAGAASGAVAGAITGGVRGAVAGLVTGGVLGGIHIAYGNRWTLGRVAAEGVTGGVGSEIQGGSFADGFRLAAGYSALRWSANAMRQAMVNQSCLPAGNLNCTGESVGTEFDMGTPRKIGGGPIAMGGAGVMGWHKGIISWRKSGANGKDIWLEILAR